MPSSASCRCANRPNPIRQPEKKDEKPSTKADKKVDAGGVVVRMVYPGSPAATAGIQIGDRIVKIDDAKIDGIKSAIAAMNNVVPAADVAVGHCPRRQADSIDRLRPTGCPSGVPSELPAAYAAPAKSENGADGAAAKTELKLEELKLAEFPQKCRVYLPSNLATGPAGRGRDLAPCTWQSS